MVNYAEEADFIGKKKSKKFVSAAEAKARRDARNAARSESDWCSYAREIVYRQLSIRDRSSHELLTALHTREVPDTIAQETVQAFIESDIVNDARFARSFVRMRFAEKSISRRSLAIELAKRGIDSDDAQAAIEQIDADAEEESACNFARRKSRTMVGLEQVVAYRRLYGALARRGFSPSVSRAAVTNALEELRQEEDNG